MIYDMNMYFFVQRYNIVDVHTSVIGAEGGDSGVPSCVVGMLPVMVVMAAYSSSGRLWQNRKSQKGRTHEYC